MPPNNDRICFRDLTAAKIKRMTTYNFRGFVGNIERKGELYLIKQITGRPAIVGQGSTIEEALASFENAVIDLLKDTSRDSQKKMIIRKYAKAEAIHKRLRAIKEAELLRRKRSGD